MISCVILTKDEEADVERCLRSLSWADDVHVVDSGSTDSTVARASALGATVTTHRPDGPFVIVDQRNWALDHLPLRHDWVLFLDADEESTDAFAAAVQGAARSGGGADAFWCAPVFMYQGTWLRRTKGYPNWHPRLLRASAVRLVGGVWESFPDGARTGHVRTPYLHYPNSKGLPAWVEKHVRYATWEAGVQAGDAPRVEGDRRVPLRALAASLGPLRPLASVVGTLVLRRALLDGRGALSYVRRVLIFELLVREAVAERRAVDAGRPL